MSRYCRKCGLYIPDFSEHCLVCGPDREEAVPDPPEKVSSILKEMCRGCPKYDVKENMCRHKMTNYCLQKYGHYYGKAAAGDTTEPRKMITRVERLIPKEERDELPELNLTQLFEGHKNKVRIGGISLKNAFSPELPSVNVFVTDDFGRDFSGKVIRGKQISVLQLTIIGEREKC